jgi:hypothetical protein
MERRTRSTMDQHVMMCPPPNVVAGEPKENLEEDLREADFEGQVTRALAEIELPSDTDMGDRHQGQVGGHPSRGVA